MKYLLFAGHRYYPQGGMKDFRGEFQSIDEAKQYCRDNKETIAGGNGYIDNWADIIEKDSMTSVAYGMISESPYTKEKTESWHKNREAWMEDL